MNYAVEMASGGMIYIEIGVGRSLIVKGRDTHTHARTHTAR
jgi:hypothetical protein